MTATLRQRNVVILGSTGSIGTSTLDVIRRHPDRFSVLALTAHRNIDLLVAQCVEFKPRIVAVPDAERAARTREALTARGLQDIEVMDTPTHLAQVAAHADADMIMAAIVGAAGLPATLAAVEAGKTVLLANKEALVMSGPLFMQAARRAGALLLPIDSEHNAIFQALPVNFREGLDRAGVRKIILTASGGPFRTLPLDALQSVTPDEACAHPNWVMGRKISVDSATMMNKGLEVIEARWLFNAAPDQVEVLIHPQSIIHSMVSYHDGSVLAQLGNPDMRTPIACAMAWPERIDAGVAPLDLTRSGRLDFEAPDETRFPCLKLAREAMLRGGGAPTLLNAANEVAVEAFLDQRLPFMRIADVVKSVLDELPVEELPDLDAVYAADRSAREVASRSVMSRIFASTP
ncbi:MAG: 1-deoxy-D-xylulose-5-phosphate reductoisomerase [Betaproteobacteria bacterium]|nr:1-deoxy-D-xylulose-5-phosphate reductoisomerase [Betaproteobacteria bacterium]